MTLRVEHAERRAAWHDSQVAGQSRRRQRTEEVAMLGTILAAVLLLGFALLAYWADVENTHARCDQRALERARGRRLRP
jgi:hypothetical protein